MGPSSLFGIATVGRSSSAMTPEFLRAVCEIWLAARAAGALQDQQQDKAQRAELLMRALADIGIVALVDEATGYQQYRALDELQKILAAYVAPELLPWAKRFPDVFYEELHRVWGWVYKSGSKNRTSYIGKLTNNLVDGDRGFCYGMLTAGTAGRGPAIRRASSNG